MADRAAVGDTFAHKALDVDPADPRSAAPSKSVARRLSKGKIVGDLVL